MGKYNGWTNYETWAWNLWISNDEAEYNFWLDEARSWIAHGEGNPIWNLAEQLEAAADKVVENTIGEKAGPVVDILNAGINAINWREIAEHLVDAIAERATHRYG